MHAPVINRRRRHNEDNDEVCSIAGPIACAAILTGIALLAVFVFSSAFDNDDDDRRANGVWSEPSTPTLPSVTQSQNARCSDYCTSSGTFRPTAGGPSNWEASTGLCVYTFAKLPNVYLPSTKKPANYDENFCEPTPTSQASSFGEYDKCAYAGACRLTIPSNPSYKHLHYAQLAEKIEATSSEYTMDSPKPEYVAVVESINEACEPIDVQTYASPGKVKDGTLICCCA